jgi:hypothetical protein
VFRRVREIKARFTDSSAGKSSKLMLPPQRERIDPPNKLSSAKGAGLDFDWSVRETDFRQVLRAAVDLNGTHSRLCEHRAFIVLGLEQITNRDDSLDVLFTS